MSNRIGNKSLPYAKRKVHSWGPQSFIIHKDTHSHDPHIILPMKTAVPGMFLNITLICTVKGWNYYCNWQTVS